MRWFARNSSPAMPDPLSRHVGTGDLFDLSGAELGAGRVHAMATEVLGGVMRAKLLKPLPMDVAQLRLTVAAPNDARHYIQVEVRRVDAASVQVRARGSWMRFQQRAFVRVDVQHLPVRVIRSLKEARPDAVLLHASDIGAGGLRLIGPEALLRGEQYLSSFALQGLSALQLGVEVMHAQELHGGRRATFAMGVRFVEVDDGTRAALTRWVFQQQIAQRRRTG